MYINSIKGYPTRFYLAGLGLIFPLQRTSVWCVTLSFQAGRGTASLDICRCSSSPN
ncbi:hypothetical protein M407DRAFT_117658 [Tulasnella calospora MUT 4182]|uniref:Uncharacterized protein n=1 Tax=Tulasnella calospora MUT 4182 TaxID=1051891 RepID=A0A0C3LMF1_9AGAM|nr:hypothetical protein M407DRAFT_117658 [Tulasnella calospora MUT 4182]